VDDGGCINLIYEIDMKALARRKRDARFPVWPDKTENSCGFAIDVEGSGTGGQAKRSGAGFGRGNSLRHLQKGDRAGHGNAGRKDLPAG
jgi:hypothetical protein